MKHVVGDRIGGTDLYTGNVYIGTVYKVDTTHYWINVDGGGIMFLDGGFDKIKPVCKAREIVYV